LAVDKEEFLYRELRGLRTILERIEALLEEQLIGIEEPLPDEAEAIREYEDEKRKGKVELVDLEDILRELKMKRYSHSTFGAGYNVVYS